ncbi:hypothetical protein O181_129966 [Austropuccinia psidii MF-1]|uniref:Reverse transcriptase Ty1/copia-type domain-containing protein n=1 Tax=Austropuccinia psidii MF-1 TaxID=1389203 RepID=A0A9Q3L146_9BASI|nr:hypothetical protein [Austropuccinia psidii MF-1]
MEETKKHHLNEISKYKSRLCTQGYTQTNGPDYKKTFSPTGNLNSLRALIAHTVNNKLELHQIDIKSAFSNAPLIETVYLTIPQGIRLHSQKQCLRLNKVLYRLKKGPLSWYKTLKNLLSQSGFTTCILDPCVFHKTKPNPIWLCLHVDEIAIFGKEVNRFQDEIRKEFNIKDIVLANLMLGIKVNHQESGISLDQQHFIKALLEKYRMTPCTPVNTPLVPHCNLTPATEEEINTFKQLKINFRSAIRSINYLSSATRPDLSFAVSALSQHLEKPGTLHWRACLHILKYLNGTQELGLVYEKSPNNCIEAYCDSDRGNCRVTRRLVTRYLA